MLSAWLEVGIVGVVRGKWRGRSQGERLWTYG